MSAIAQRSFVGGELSPSLYARTDVSKYATGLRTCRNFMVMRHGGVTNRPGTQFVGEVKDSTKTVRLIPFIFNSDQAYVLEFGNLSMRVIRNGAYVTETAQAISAVTNANPAVLTYVGADNYANGDQIYITGVVGAMANYINGRTFIVAGVDVALNTFQLNYLNGTAVNSTTWGAYASAGTVAEIYKITTTYVEADLPTLQFSQSADVVTIVHPTYPPRNLSRTGHAAWTIANVTFGPAQAAPTNLASSTAGINGPVSWAITAVSATGEESLINYTIPALGAAAAPTSAAPATITWTAAAGAVSYNIYRNDHNSTSSAFGFIAQAAGSGFIDNGITPDYTDLAPPSTATNPFGTANNYPSAVMYSKGRLFYAATNNNPETIWASQVGYFTNFEATFTLQDDEAIKFTLSGRSVATIRHLIDASGLLVLTSQSEYALIGNATGIVTPAEINPRQYSTIGVSQIYPLLVNGAILFVQARNTQIRDMNFEFQTDSYRGSELSIFSSHLFDGYTVKDWTYQQIPHSIIWVVRSDGVLLGLTYVHEQELLAWHRHDFQDATVEQVCAVPESTEDYLYLVVKRTVNGATVRYIERMNSRRFSAITSAVFMDAALSYSGVNSTATTMTLSGGTAWTYDEQLTLTASASFFASTDVGNRIDLTSSAGDILRCTIIAYTSATVVTVNAHMTVPVLLRTTARTTWTKAVKAVSGLWHLEAKSVSAFGDGFVVANPNNSALTAVTVTNGVATFDKPYGIIHVGLPILADMETLDIDQAQGETLADKKKIITKVTAFLQESRGLWAGPKPPTDDTTNPVENLTELKIRNEENYDDPVALVTDSVDINISGESNSNGRVFLRQLDPVPCSVLSVTPTGLVPYQRGG